MVAVRGGLAILAALIAFLAPIAAVMGLVMLAGVYLLIDGAMACGAAIHQRGSYSRWWVALAEGILGIVAGVVALVVPLTASIAFIWLFAGWALITGVVQLVVAVELRREIDGEWLLGAAGAASVLVGLLMIAMPGAGIVAVAWFFGAYCAIFGAAMLMLALRLRHRGVSGRAALSTH
jgi:uncharacterized membrane protein HdeD (DUF308 family)